MKKTLLLLLLIFLAPPAEAASRFWVGGTGSFSDTAHWSATSGGAGGASVPGSSDTATWNGSSGGGTVTIDCAGPVTISVQSITMGAFTGTWNNSTNNCNFSLSAAGSAMNLSGSGTRTINLGSATYTLTNSSGVVYDVTTATGLTYNATSSNVVFTGAGENSIATAASLTHGNFTVSGEVFSFIGNTTTLSSLSATAPTTISFSSTLNLTVTNALNITGTSTQSILFRASTVGNDAVVNIASGSTGTWIAFRDITFGSNTMSATNCANLGGNTNLSSCTAPSPAPTGNGSTAIFGGWLLWGDITGRGHDNDNHPAWLERAG